ncbi:MAG: TonB-dependent receptor [Gammaproteobacteria bacterium]|nr:TonB-dependent receptor [Gammaproteobacteria bacterium]
MRVRGGVAIRAWTVFLLCPLTVAAVTELPPVNSEEIVVTAARIPIPQRQAGPGVTVISRETIEARNPRYVTDLLRDVPGFAVSRLGGAGKQTQLRVRGAEAHHVMVLIDGVEANDFSLDDAFDFAHLQADEIERIEIVRGPQSALWGSDALAGTINIITREADKALTARGGVEYGSFDTETFKGSVGTQQTNYHANAAVSYVDSGGINVAELGNEEDGYRNGTANLRVGWRIRDDLSLALSGRLVEAENERDSDLGLGVPSDTPGVTDVFQAYSGANLIWTGWEGRWVNTLSGTYSRMDNHDVDSTQFLPESQAEGNKYRGAAQSTVKLATNHGVASMHALTVALDYEKQDFTQRGPIVFGLDPNQEREFSTYSYCGEYRITVAENTLLAASGRYDDSDEFESNGTYRVSLSHSFPVTATSATLSYGTGQKSPTFTDRFGFFAGGFLPFIGNPGLTPEKSEGYEFGLRQALFGKRLELGATYFNEKLLDEIEGFVVDPTGAFFTAVNLDGTSKRRGIELSFKANLSRQIDLSSSYTYLDATEVEATGLRSDEIRRPRHQGGINATWRSANARTQLNINAAYTGDHLDDWFPPPTFTKTRVTLDSYTLVGISATQALSRGWSLTVRVDNLTDDEYQDVFGFETEGVAGYLGLKYDFGL